MTREEAEKELAELEPKVDLAWKAVTDRAEIRNKKYSELKAKLEMVYPDSERDLKILDDAWLPLYSRKQHLKKFLGLE